MGRRREGRLRGEGRRVIYYSHALKCVQTCRLLLIGQRIVVVHTGRLHANMVILDSESLHQLPKLIIRSASSSVAYACH